MSLIIALIFLGLILAGLISSGVAIHNRLVMLKFNVEKAFANIDVLLKQRADEIPNLITVVKENMQYEQETLTQLTQLRTKYLQTNNADEKVELSNQMGRALSKIIAVSENYPELKANNNFVKLQERVSKIEDAIADRREFFNESVNMYNIGINQFPDVIFANILGYKDKHLLHIREAEKEYDGVKF